MTRATVYTPAIADAICESIANGNSLAKTCEAPEMPGLRTVFTWLRDEAHREFKAAFESAKEERAHALAEQCLDIADETVGMVETQHGKHMDAGQVQNKRVRVETRKWFAAKLLPHVYADKHIGELSGPKGGAIPVSVTPQVPDYDALIAAFKAKYGDIQIGPVSP